MSKVYKAAVTFHNVSGFPEDDFVNTWHFAAGALNTNTDAANATIIATRLQDFYTGVHSPSSFQIGLRLSAEISRTTQPEIDVYDAIAGGSPVLHTGMTGLAAAGSAGCQVSEAAICLSYAGNLGGIPEEVPGGAPGPAGDTHPAARRRGRVYLGPWCDQARDSSVTTPARPNPTLIDEIRNGALALVAANSAGTALTHVDWVVFSPTGQAANPTSDNFVIVTNGWVDNAFDTQRRRGPAATARHTW